MHFRNKGTAFLTTLTFIAALALTATHSIGEAAVASTNTATTRQMASVRWGFYITYNPNSLTSLRANVSSLNYVSPWYFNVDPAGQVSGREQATANALIRNAGAKILPMVKNTPQYNDFTAILTDTVKQDAMVAQIDGIVTAGSYDGITIDFEGLNASDKPLLTAFMGKLYARLHPKGKLVAMAVAAQVRDTNDGWAGCYDYSALARLTDYILIMAYDYHWATGDPGPIAPMQKLRDTAIYALSKIPASKLIWGVGVYGYDWPTSAPGVSSGHADYRNYAEATAIADLPGVESGYDEGAQAPYVRYVKEGKTREMWYENRRSFEAKLGLIAQYNMAGFGLWRIGQEDPGIWDAMSGNTAPPSPLLANTATPRRTSTVKPTSTSTLTPTATPRPQPPAACNAIQPFTSSAEQLYFRPTGHSLGGQFLQYWQAHGGLPVFGYPLTEEFTEKSQTDGKPYKVQYFERNRFEYHPESAPPNDIQLGLLGVQALGNHTFAIASDFDPGPYTIYFPQVKHSMSGPFLAYWQRNGGVSQLGYPISEPILERNPRDGQTYTVQYMERARFELHPENAGSPYEVLLGLLGLNVSPCR